ncbi:hypothetical protein QWJ07_28700 [Frankia sp. RB7]|nr:hypothetical protein [Frankia sp. RB7]
MRMIWPGSARGSRGSQCPASTWAMNSVKLFDKFGMTKLKATTFAIRGDGPTN